MRCHLCVAIYAVQSMRRRGESGGHGSARSPRMPRPRAATRRRRGGDGEHAYAKPPAKPIRRAATGRPRGGGGEHGAAHSQIRRHIRASSVWGMLFQTQCSHSCVGTARPRHRVASGPKLSPLPKSKEAPRRSAPTVAPWCREGARPPWADDGPDALLSP